LQAISRHWDSRSHFFQFSGIELIGLTGLVSPISPISPINPIHVLVQSARRSNKIISLRHGTKRRRQLGIRAIEAWCDVDTVYTLRIFGMVCGGLLVGD
jgi:hypothetical protein